MWVGDNDVGGNPEQPFPIAESNREYHAALQEAGYDAELIEVPGGHEVIERHCDAFIDTIVETARPD
jgi:predicted esterase